ncbi:mitochondrial NADH dehydrogenase [Lactarius deliciosus]|nr:mitochondrial NADH dehydrogenase [Lactarius deliciosus]
MISRFALRSHFPLQRINIGARPPCNLRFLSVSPTSTPPGPNRFLRVTRTAAKYTAFTCFSAVLGLSVLVGGVFIHDAFTYSDKHVDRVPVSPLALHPERGGPKNLPIASVLVGDEDDGALVAVKDKPRLVIVGGGWGAVGVLQTIHPGDYHVTIVSPDTFTTFTPLLPSAAVGTVSVRSLIESLRKVIARLHGQLINGRAVDIVMSDRLLEVETVCATGEHRNIYLPYDKLVIAVGSVSSTHGVPGLEHCFQLKTVGDAQAIRRRILDNFESASLPSTSEEERKRLLSFVVCGGGPTGVETAAEIFDLCQEDIINYFPKLLRKDVSIHVIQSREHILNTYSEAISKYAEDKFQRDDVQLVTSARVREVHPDQVVYTTRDPDTGKVIEHTIPTNFVLWSTGISMNPFTSRVSSLLPNQVHKKAIEVDAHLRVKGAPLGDVYAIGDCATIETSIVSHLLELVEEADRNRDGKIDFEEWEIMVKRIKKQIPMAATHLEKACNTRLQVRSLFDLYDSDSDNTLNLNELAVLLQEIGNKITALPATAQVASQQGKYLGHKLHLLAAKRDVLLANELPPATDEAVAGAFNYRHLGSLAYIGNAAVFDFGRLSFMGGLAAMYAWRSIYWSEQVSMRTRALLMIDWVVRGVWGRDLSRL